MRSHFWPFIEVQNGNQREVTTKAQKYLGTTDCPDITDKGKSEKRGEGTQDSKQKITKETKNYVLFMLIFFVFGQNPFLGVASYPSVLSDGALLLRREGGDDFFEARLAAQRIPPRHQFQFAIADVAGRLDDDGELFAGEIFLSNPRCNHCKVSDEVPADECFFLRRKKLKCATAFAQRFLFPAEASVDHTQHAPTPDRNPVAPRRFSPALRVQRQRPAVLCAHRLSCAR